ncbi:TMAO reductase system periplasmic protein TorT [Pseudomonas sp.]|uniref:TMAO reductase system periplasmic protein TorT n=1 Tax=Pseudomonas sp. TaxID=306 RepID=UPI003982B624
MRAIYLTLCWICMSGQALATDWYPVDVLADGVSQQYQPLPNAAKPWRICALLPHGKDRYWWGVAWGLDEEATRQGVRLGIYEARGYENPQVQAQQLQNCQQRNADAYVIAAIDAQGLCTAIAQLVEQGKPVIDLVNGIDCPGLSASSSVDFADMTGAALAYIDNHRPSGPFSLGWLPGPQGAGWVLDSERALRQAEQVKPLTVQHGGYAPVDRASQAQLVRELLRQHPHLDFLLGNAEAAGFAAQLVQTSGQNYRAQVLATYTTERIVEQIRDGFIVAAPTDSPVLQARIAVDLAVRALEGRSHAQRVSPLIEMLDQGSLAQFDISRLMPPPEHWMIRRELPQ